MSNEMVTTLLMIADWAVVGIGWWFAMAALYAYCTDRVLAAVFCCFPLVAAALGAISLTASIAERHGPMDMLYSGMIGSVVIVTITEVMYGLVKGRR